jgi:hypothetical protein
MKNKLLIFLALAAAMVTFTAESCFVSTKEVEVPVRGEGDLEFHATGTSDSKTETIDFTQLMEDLESDSAFDALVSANIENGYWHVTRNQGDPHTMLTGHLTVQREGSAAPAVSLIDYTSIDVADVSGDFVVAPLNAAGVNLLNAGFDEYLQAKAADTALPNLRFVFTWTSSASPAPVDFYWEGKVKFVLVGLTTVDVPEL